MTITRPAAAPAVTRGRILTTVLTVAFVAGAVLVMALVSDTLTDLRVYRAGGQALLDGTPLYDASDPRTGLPFTYTPFGALLFVPAALLPFAVSMAAANAIAAAALVRSAWLLARLAHGPAVRGLIVAGIVGAAALTEPVGSTIGLGQVNLLVLWLILEDLIGAVPPRWRGVLIGVACGLKLTPGLFIVYFLATRRWADAARAAAAGAATVLVGFLLQPAQAWEYWTGIAYDDDRMGAVEYAGNQSIHGAVERLFGPAVPMTVWAPVAVAVAVLGIVTAVAHHRRGHELQAITAVAVTMLLVSPLSWNHHWVWVLLLVVLATAPGLGRAARCWLAAGVLVFVSRAIWLVEYRDGAEFGTTGLALLPQNAYVIVGAAVLAWLAVRARRPAGDAARG